jgi:hypothetical protein
MAFSFDGPNKLVILSAGTVSIDLAEMYSRYKDWLLLGNAGHALAFSTVGGEPIDPAAGTLVPLYLFLLNGWRIRPQEANHTLIVTGGTLLVDGGGDPFVDTLGNYRVRIRYSQPVQAMGYNSGSVVAGLTPAQESALMLALKILRNKQVTDPSTGQMTVYDDDGSVLLTANLYEDVSGSQQYRGQGAERRERLA